MKGGEEEGEKGEVERGRWGGSGRVNLPNGAWRREKRESRGEKVESRRRGFSTLLDSGHGFSVSYRWVDYL